MNHARGSWRAEVLPTLQLAGPMMLGQLGLMAMGLVDTAVVGRLGPAAVASSGVAHAVFMTTFVFGLGLILGLDRTVAFAVGAGRRDEAASILWQGLIIATVAGSVLTGTALVVSENLHRIGLPTEVHDGARVYLRVLAFSILPSMLFTAARQALQGLGETRVATVTMLAANLVNLGGNLWFVNGGLGLAPMGIAGSAAATVLSRALMAAVMVFFALRHMGHRESWRVDRQRLRELFRLGWPAGVQMIFEGGVFSLVNLLAARLGAVPGAASQVVLQVASFTFMLPLGLSAAGSIRVGQALGEGDPVAARRAARVAVGLAIVMMSLVAVVMVVLARPLVQLFGLGEDVVTVGRQLLFCAGMFQLADGAQVTLAGVLRGSGETLSAMAANLFGHWAVGLPLGAWLCYRLGWGATGLWVGLASGLMLVALVLGWVWRRRIDRLCRGELQVTA